MLIDTPVGMLHLVSTTTVFGSPTEITLQKLALETFFPCDEDTARILRSLAGGRPDGHRWSEAHGVVATGRPQFCQPMADTDGMSRCSRLHRAHLRHACAWLLLWAAAWPALVLAGAAPAREAEWTPSPDGQTLYQRSTGLVWQRCVLGMHWNGRDCAGQPLWADHAQATALARQRAQTDGQAWRLPHLPELKQLAHLGAQAHQRWLPESTQGWVWSGTIPIEVRSLNPYSYANVMSGATSQTVTEMKFLHAWVVNTATGESRDDVLKRTPMFVRLVRKAEEP